MDNLKRYDIIEKIGTKIRLWIIICFVIGLLVSTYGLGKAEMPPASKTNPFPKNVLTHEQLVWTYVLEWCESRGKGVMAVNPNDLDGTPSYFWFQFKPKTFQYYVRKYRLLPIVIVRDDADWMNLLADGDIQRAIVERMVNDPNVRWSQEFPGCTAKYGSPPK